MVSSYYDENTISSLEKMARLENNNNCRNNEESYY
jgi:hypothetical protein